MFLLKSVFFCVSVNPWIFFFGLIFSPLCAEFRLEGSLLWCRMLPAVGKSSPWVWMGPAHLGAGSVRVSAIAGLPVLLPFPQSLTLLVHLDSQLRLLGTGNLQGPLKHLLPGLRASRQGAGTAGLCSLDSYPMGLRHFTAQYLVP